MKKKNEAIFGLLLLLTIFLLLKNFLFIPLSNSIFMNIINPLFWISITIYSYFSLNGKYFRIKDKFEKIKILIIILLTYLIIYFSLGLFIGYEVSPYSHSVKGLLMNSWSMIFVGILIEYTRYVLIKNYNGSALKYIVIIILFSLFDITFASYLTGVSSFSNAIKYYFGILIPIFAKNALLTYLSKSSGIMPAIIYKGFLLIMIICLPIFPKSNWYVTGIIGIILPSLIFLFIYNFIDKKKKDNRAPRKYKKTFNFPLYAFLVVLIFFFYGIFQYQPIAIMSNSMVPTFKRGDAVIIQNINKIKQSDIKVETIIAYSLDNIVVIHRVAEIIEINNVIMYRTKGDNNSSSDSKLVNYDQVIGIVSFYIPFIGYPSIFIQSLIKNDEVNVET